MGLKEFRNSRATKPEHHCSNCGRGRYTPCTCMKGDKWMEAQRKKNEEESK